MSHQPRIRTLKPENWQDEAIGGLSRDARLLRDVLITFADDDGRWRHLPSAIIGFGYPYDDDLSPAKVKRWTKELVASGLVIVYEHAGVEYGCFPTWHLHQQINKYRPSGLPGCDDARVVPRAADVEGDGAGRRGPAGYRKVAVPDRVRREVARRYGGEAGAQTVAKCELCDREGTIDWTGSASWVTFSGLEIDHKVPEVDGGSGDDPANLWLLCRQCNRRKGTKRIPETDVRVSVQETPRDSVGDPHTRAPAYAGGSGSGSVPRSVPSPPDQDARIADDRVLETVAILRTCSRLVFDPELMGVANALLAYPNVDHRQAAHTTVSNASDPNYRTTDAGRALRYALIDLDRRRSQGTSSNGRSLHPVDQADQELAELAESLRSERGAA